MYLSICWITEAGNAMYKLGIEESTVFVGSSPPACGRAKYEALWQWVELAKKLWFGNLGTKTAHEACSSKIYIK